MNPQYMIFALLQANQIKKHMEDRKIPVENNFALKQAVVASVLPNPLVSSLLIQNEIQKLDSSPINPAAREEIVKQGEVLQATINEKVAVIANKDREIQSKSAQLAEKETEIQQFQTDRSNIAAWLADDAVTIEKDPAGFLKLTPKSGKLLEILNAANPVVEFRKMFKANIPPGGLPNTGGGS